MIPPLRTARTRGRSRGVAEAAVVIVGYAIYSALRDLVPRHAAAAVRHGRDLLQAEGAVGLSVEHLLNRWMSARPGWSGFATFWYSDAHFVVTAVLLFATARLPDGRRWRRVWYLTTGIGLLVFWLYPTAPPRLLPRGGFTDVVAARPTVGSVSDPAIAHLSNPYAAMPSLHVAWAIWCTLVGWQLLQRDRRSENMARHPWRGTWVLRAACVAYPLTTSWLVLATANHYLADVVAGALTTAAAWSLTRIGRNQARAPIAALVRHPSGARWRRASRQRHHRDPRRGVGPALLAPAAVILTACTAGARPSAPATVTFHGLRISVPEGWSVGHTLCVDRSAVVTSPVDRAPCPPSAGGQLDHGRTVIILSCATGPNGFPASTLTATHLGTEPVLVPDPHGPLAASYVFVELPRLNTALTITGPASTARARLATLRIPHATPPSAQLARDC